MSSRKRPAAAKTKSLKTKDDADGVSASSCSPAKRKPRAPKGMSKPLPPGQILTDLRKKEWKLGSLIGQGGFGYLYLGSDNVTKAVTYSAEYVIKVEPHTNGPLFVELAFYQRVAKPEMIASWMKSHKLGHLGVPRYIGSGSFDNSGTKYRFMVMDRFGQDVEKIYLSSGKKFPIETVFTLGLRIIDALEYIHEQEYVHADIKASNLMTGRGKNGNKLVYLLDYGLAYRYCPGGQHVPYKEDPKRKHDGTVEYTSRDAHKGAAPCRRGDLEILGYCMVQWLCAKLPWETKLNDKEYVMREKIKHMNDIPAFMRCCFPSGKPAEIESFLSCVNKLDYTQKPDYDRLRKILRDGLKERGFSDDGKSVIFPTGGESSGSATSSPRKRGRKPADAEEAMNGDAKATAPKRKAKEFLSDEDDLSEDLPKGSVAKSACSPSPKKSARKTSSPAKKRKSPTQKPSGTEGTRRKVARPRKKPVMVDFAQSP